MTSAISGPGIIVPTAKQVPGKDFSDVLDRNAAAAADPEQVVAWDGLGGVRDSLDYSGSRAAYPNVAHDIEVDGIANANDSLFNALRANQAALLFSVENDPTILFERATGFPAAPSGYGVWATASDIDLMNPPLDTDGLEVWGSDQVDDSFRYSLVADPLVNLGPAAAKVAIWAFNSMAGISVPHTLTTDLAAAIDLQFMGPGVGGTYWSQLVELMDVDAIMVLNEQVIFSIRPLTVPGTPIAFDGGEIFVYDGPGVPTEFLNHGGYLWDTAFDIRGTFGVNNENIDALEAVAQVVPEPASLAMLLVGLLAACGCRRRW
jgi:hypothetical protein